MDAIQKGNLKMVELIIAHPTCDVNIKNNDGHTAMDFANNIQSISKSQAIKYLIRTKK